MNVLEITSVIVAVVSVLGIVFGILKYTAGRIHRVYERFDEHKKTVEIQMKEDFTKKEICQIIHGQIDKRLETIEVQTKLIPEIAAKLEIILNEIHIST